MPKVKSYSAPWLSSQSPGGALFQPSSDSNKSRSLSSAVSSKNKPHNGPRRTIAHRGTEAFVACGKEIRWGDLAYLKEEYGHKQARARSSTRGPRVKREESMMSIDDGGEEDNPLGIRRIKTRVAEDIQQLIISPNDDFLAILTTHTVHICILPDSSHLTSGDTEPLKANMFTLGPTIHVTSRSPVTTALWHPLGVNGSCLVTVTGDSIVRVWEISATDRWSFDQPTTSIDLKKLADGMNLEQDFSATDVRTNSGFSPDSFDMEVASASFASRDSGGWNPMTLWIAMRGGDLYALCPLLPQKWAPPPTLLPSLSVSVVSTVASIEDDPEVEEHEKLLAQQQFEWMAELDEHEPTIVTGPPSDPEIEVYSRPSRPGSIPRLQGPIELDSDPDTGDDLDTSITDILVIGKKTETEELMMGEDEELVMDEGDEKDASMAIICTLSTSGQIRVYLDLDGVQAQWLPPKTKTKSRVGQLLADVDPPSLMAFQGIDTMSPVEITEESWPTFSRDVMSTYADVKSKPYSFFVTHHAAITSIDLSPWVFRLDKELAGDGEAGADFRLGLVVNTQSSRDRVFSQSTADVTVPLAAAVPIFDRDIGYLLLSATPYGPVTVIFDTPDEDFDPIKLESPVHERQPSVAVVPQMDFYEPRPVYTPSHTFDDPSSLPTLLARLRSSRHKTVVNQEIRLSPLTLQIFTDVHKVLSEETYRLGAAASEVFKRCELLQRELQVQISKANGLRNKVDAINGSNNDGQSDRVRLEERLTAAKNRQSKLADRVEDLRKMANKATARELSHKERAFVEEVKGLEAKVSEEEGSNGAKGPKQLWQRLENVKSLQTDLAADIEALKKKNKDEGPGAASPRIPNEIRREKLAHVQGLLDRESALVDAVSARFAKLQAL